MKFSSKIVKCPLSPIRKFEPSADMARAKNHKIYHLNIGQPDIPTPPAFFEAVKAFDTPVLSYAPSPGIPVFVSATLEYFARLGISLNAKNILTTVGGSEALGITLSTILDDGDELLVPEPYYPNYSTLAAMAGASIRPIPTSPEEGYRYAVREKILPLINENTRAILITSPGNPTGNVLSAEEMRVIADIAKEKSLFLISDEVYREFIYTGGKMSSMLEFDDIYENTIVIDSVSKRFSACGARVGVIVSRNPEFMTQAMKIVQTRLSVATLDQVGSAALYNNVDDEYFKSVRAEYKLRRDAALSKLSEIPGIVSEKPDGAFYIMAKLPVDSSEKLLKFLLEEFDDKGETVMFAPGSGFYASPGKGISEARMAYVLAKPDLERALELLKLGIEAYNSQS